MTILSATNLLIFVTFLFVFLSVSEFEKKTILVCTQCAIYRPVY